MMILRMRLSKKKKNLVLKKKNPLYIIFLVINILKNRGESLQGESKNKNISKK